MIVDFSTRAYPLAVRSLLRPRHCTVPAYVAHSLPKHAEQRVSTYDVPVCIQRCCCCCCCPVCCYSAAVNSCCCCLLLFTIVHLPPEVVLHAIQTAEVVVFTAKYIYIYLVHVLRTSILYCSTPLFVQYSRSCAASAYLHRML